MGLANASDKRGTDYNAESAKGQEVKALYLSLLSVLISSCAFVPVHSISDYKELTPEQIKAMQALKMDTYACVTIAGPPPVGRAVYVYVPQLDKKPDVRFGPDCQIK